MRVRVYLKGGAAFEVDATTFNVSVHGATQRIVGYEWHLDENYAPESNEEKWLMYLDSSEIAAIVAIKKADEEGNLGIETVHPLSKDIQNVEVTQSTEAEDDEAQAEEGD